MGNVLKTGSKGDAVRAVQTKLVQLGFDVSVDGDFGAGTDSAVRTLQSMFGYTSDGMVGDGTQQLIDAQIGYGWNAKLPDAKARAAASQSTGPKAPMTAVPAGQQSKFGNATKG